MQQREAFLQFFIPLAAHIAQREFPKSQTAFVHVAEARFVRHIEREQDNVDVVMMVARYL